MEIMLIRMPFMIGGKSCPDYSIPSLWPGLPDKPDGYWEPADYPFDPQTAQRILGDFSNLGLADLESMRLRLTVQTLRDELSYQDEMSALAGFCGQQIHDAFQRAREQAHKALIWRWHMEEQINEIARLEALCMKAERLLPAPFMESSMQIPAPTEPAPLAAPWQSVVASAAWFLTPDQEIFAEGAMFEDMREYLDFTPSGQPGSGQIMISCMAPLWQALGMSQPVHNADARINHIFNVVRVWHGRIRE